MISEEDIPSVLAAFSWPAKASVLEKYSLLAMDKGRCWRFDTKVPLPYPWELSQIAALAAISRDGTMETVPDELFRGIVNSLRMRAPRVELKSARDAKNFLSYEVAGIQFPYQQDALVHFFRYHYLLRHVDVEHSINMPDLFRHRFGVDYEDVALLSVLEFLSAASDKSLGRYVMDFCTLFTRVPSALFKSIVDLFSMDRGEYAKRQSGMIAFSTDGVANAENLLEQYPFIKMGSRYFAPLPFLISRATTRHLFDRMMQCDKGLRSKVGRYVMEPYVRHLFEISKSYEGIQGEVSYRIGRDNIASPEICLHDQGQTVFVDVKLYEAPIKLRQMYDRTMENALKLIAEFVYQLYSRVKEICEGRALPGLSAVWDRTFGIIVLHEDTYVVRGDIYNKCFEMHPELTEGKREFIRTHIIPVALYSIEEHCYRHQSVLPSLLKRRDDPPGNESIMVGQDFVSGRAPDFPIDEYLMPLVAKIQERLFVPLDGNVLFRGQRQQGPFLYETNL